MCAMGHLIQSNDALRQQRTDSPRHLGGAIKIQMIKIFPILLLRKNIFDRDDLSPSLINGSVVRDIGLTKGRQIEEFDGNASLLRKIENLVYVVVHVAIFQPIKVSTQHVQIFLFCTQLSIRFQLCWIKPSISKLESKPCRGPERNVCCLPLIHRNLLDRNGF